MIPCFRYRDAKAAIDWLERAFGFERKLVVPMDDGSIAHAQLTLAGGMIMVSTLRSSPYDDLLTHPDQTGGKPTQSPYIVIAEIDALFERASDAGAEILQPLEEQDYGGKMFTCRDLEGYIWNFGSYDPWDEPQS